MRYLILSDIHGNRQALESVLDDAIGRYDRVLCLGDVVGYGADPNSVTDWVREGSAHTVRGNHDRACTGDPILETFSENATIAALWTQTELNDGNREYLAGLPSGPLAVNGFWLVHGSPRDEDEYILNKNDAAHQYPFVQGDLTFFGHTHVQVGFGMRQGRVWTMPPPELDETEAVYQIEPDSVYLVNPGSIGQPRDSDPRAGYAIFDPERKLIAFRRAHYDVPGAQRAIMDAGLPRFLADRLGFGR